MGMTTCENHKNAAVDKLCCHVCFQEAVAERDQLRVYADQLKAKMEKDDRAYDLLAAESDERRREKERILGLLRDTKMKHGTCQPRSRKACTACNAQEELDRIVSAWKGFTMELS